MGTPFWFSPPFATPARRSTSPLSKPFVGFVSDCRSDGLSISALSALSPSRFLCLSLSTSCTDVLGRPYDSVDVFTVNTLEYGCRRVACSSACARRLHFAVPGASDGSSGNNSGSGGGGGGGGRIKFPSRRKQFLGFVALSQWLLEQLGNAGDGDGDSGGGCGPISIATSSSDAPTAVCTNLLRVCQVRWCPCRRIGRLAHSVGLLGIDLCRNKGWVMNGYHITVFSLVGVENVADKI